LTSHKAEVNDAFVVEPQMLAAYELLLAKREVGYDELSLEEQSLIEKAVQRLQSLVWKNVAKEFAGQDLPRDLAQTALLRLFDRPRVVEAPYLEAWVILTAKRELLTYLRKRTNSERQLPEDLELTLSADVALREDTEVYQAVSARCVLKNKERCIAEKFCQILRHEAEGLSVETSAELLEVSPRSINNYRRRCREIVRNLAERFE
jgi:RNA polymerase sigma factor (sigma-70 family)